MSLESLLPSIRPRDLSLFLDFDGTLVELADRPDAVKVGASLTPLLDGLRDRLDGRLAIVSGRSVAQLESMLGGLADRLALVGSHGSEVRVKGRSFVARERPEALHHAEHLFADAFAGEAGVILEVKTFGVAVHYRLAPSVGPRAIALAQSWGTENGLAVQEGKMMVELRAAGHDKGSGIATLMDGTPFNEHRPVFLGDDETDEPGFAWCEDAGGFGVLVGTPRPSVARYRLPDVAAVHSWLASL
jgi:trehalose 6-phosphate phosphatase